MYCSLVEIVILVASENTDTVRDALSNVVGQIGELSVALGDVPTWVGAIAASTTLIFLLLNLRSQSKQLKLQEQTIADQKKETLQIQRQQFASQFAFWVESGYVNPRIHFINYSVIPIYKVCVYCYEVGKTKPVNVYGSDNVTIGFTAIPMGSNYIQALSENTFDLTKPVVVYFTDSAGLKWRRGSDGELKMVKSYTLPSRWLDHPQIV